MPEGGASTAPFAVEPVAMDAAFRLYHRLPEPASARIRKLIVESGLKHEFDFRNVHYDAHREALAAFGAEATPAIWDGKELVSGEERCAAFVSGLLVRSA